MSASTTAWTEVRIGDVCDINPRERVLAVPSTLVSFIPMPAVSDKDGIILEHYTRPFKEVARGYTRFRNGDVIFAKITPCMENGKIAVAIDLHNELACGSTEFHVLRASKRILPVYLWRFLRQVEFRKKAEAHMTGAVGQRRVPKKFLADSKIPLPSIDQQRRLVKKLANLAARSKKAQDELGRVRKLVGRYKQAILGAAFTGALRQQDYSGYLMTISDVCTSLDQGWSPKCEASPSENTDDWAVIKTTAIQPINFLAHENKRLPDALKPRPRIEIMEGDVLITRAGPRNRVGITCVVKKTRRKLMLADKVYRLRLDDRLADPTYLALMLNSPQALALIEEIKTGTNDSGLNLTQDKFLKLSVPIPPLPEQRWIVKNVEATFDRIDVLLTQSVRSNSLLDRLDQAILVKAFSNGFASERESK